jgi:hypothetical protein
MPQVVIWLMLIRQAPTSANLVADAALTPDQAIDLLASMTWKESVAAAVRRLAGKTPGGAFTRQQLIDAELSQITSEVGSLGLTPEQTLSRVLQELRDDGMISFEDDNGYYRLR